MPLDPEKTKLPFIVVAHVADPNERLVELANVPNDNDRVGAERSHVHTASVRLGPQAKSARMHRQRRSQISDIRHVAGVLFALSAHDHRLHQHI